MAITYIEKSVNQSSSANTFTLAEPSGTAEDDLLICMATIGNTLIGSFTFPSDWTQLDAIDQNTLEGGGDHKQMWWGYKVRGATAGETLTFSHSEAANNYAVGIVCLRGVDTGTPFDVTYVQGTHYDRVVAGPTNGISPPITTNTDGAFVVLMATVTDDSSWTQAVPSGYTAMHLDTSFDTCHQFAYKEITTATTETPGAWGSTGLISTADWDMVTFAIRPARGKVYVNDAATKDGGEVLQTYPGFANWSDTSISMQNVIDTTGLSGQLYVGVESVDGAIAWRAITVQSGIDYPIYVPTGPIR